MKMVCCRRTQLFVQSKSQPDPYTWNAKEQYCITNVKFKENKEITKLNTQAKKMLPSGDTFGALSPCETTLRFRPKYDSNPLLAFTLVFQLPYAKHLFLNYPIHIVVSMDQQNLQMFSRINGCLSPNVVWMLLRQIAPTISMDGAKHCHLSLLLNRFDPSHVFPCVQRSKFESQQLKHTDNMRCDWISCWVILANHSSLIESGQEMA